MGPYFQLTTTTASRADAERLARLGVEGRLAACGQVSGPLTSVYRWEGAVQEAEEWRCTFKTSAHALERLCQLVRQAHDYTTPEIVATAITGGDPDYLAWIDDETTAPGG
ncbi:MAG TPA: divalent-cation tolerance protein CutA [Acidimicrobiales bacterium]|nr:divalent-cation tolerance protein CutA [Acidimicrobiales bacterium]